jgi:hypothetical protein
MADTPWRCSNCGTINEPVANSCRTCGKWPSLFDLEDNAVEDTDFEPLAESERVQQTYDAPPEPRTVEVETFEVPEPDAPKRFGPLPAEVDVDVGEVEEGEPERRPRWVSWLVPLAFVAYLIISYAFSNR